MAQADAATEREAVTLFLCRAFLVVTQHNHDSAKSEGVRWWSLMVPLAAV